jgi:hypothetical protein
MKRQCDFVSIDANKSAKMSGLQSTFPGWFGCLAPYLTPPDLAALTATSKAIEGQMRLYLTPLAFCRTDLVCTITDTWVCAINDTVGPQSMIARVLQAAVASLGWELLPGPLILPQGVVDLDNDRKLELHVSPQCDDDDKRPIRVHLRPQSGKWPLRNLLALGRAFQVRLISMLHLST